MILPGYKFGAADEDVKVGPNLDGFTYSYEVGGRRSAAKYHNPQSARFDGRRPQIVNEDGTLTPVTDESVGQLLLRAQESAA